MFKSIVLSGDSRDALKAAQWAVGEARRAKFGEHKSDALGSRVLKFYRAAIRAFFGTNPEGQKLMITLDLGRPTPRFELITDGEMARGTVSGARGLSRAERRRRDLLDGLTCVSVAA